jgi:predicted dienelactone hydrolase
VEFVDRARSRPLATRIWYPAAPGAAEVDQAYERAFVGRAAPDAPFAGGARPLVLLSHGDRGSNVNQAWLAETLAANGYVVAAVAHWMNTREQNTPEDTIRAWERPQDLSFVLSALLADPTWQPRIDPSRVGAAGHSSGGYTALALAGAVYQPLRMREYCRGPDAGPDCALAAQARIDRIDFAPASRSWRDARVRAALALAPALGPGMDPASLQAIRVPVEIIATADDELVPFRWHAARYAAGIPGAQLITLPEGGHFAFMPLCTVPATVFTWFHRFDICGRRHDVARASVHATVAAAGLRFFDRTLAAR